MDKEKGLQKVVEFQIQRANSLLCKSFLVILESLQKEHQINFDKLLKSFPENQELINMSNYFGAEKFSYLRKQVFDRAGDINRDLMCEIDKYEFKLK